MAAVNGINALAAAQETLARLPDVATTAPGAGRVRQWSEDLSRKVRMQARAVVIMEALQRLTVLVYETDPHGHRYNVDVDGRITCAYPMGRQGHTQFGLVRSEWAILRHWLTVCARRAARGADAPPLYHYDGDARTWFANIFDYPTPAAAWGWLERHQLTADEYMEARRLTKKRSKD